MMKPPSVCVEYAYQLNLHCIASPGIHPPFLCSSGIFNSRTVRQRDPFSLLLCRLRWCRTQRDAAGDAAKQLSFSRIFLHTCPLRPGAFDSHVPSLRFAPRDGRPTEPKSRV